MRHFATVIASRLLLHPVRLRIVNAVLDGREFTTAELCRRLPDVSKATVYRQLALLVAGDLVHVVGEERIRGGVQRTYRISGRRPLLGVDDMAQLTTRDHRDLMAHLATTTMAEFDRYLARSDAEIDATSYRQYGLWLTEAERDQLRSDLDLLIKRYSSGAPTSERQSHLLTAVLFPNGPADERDRPTKAPT